MRKRRFDDPERRVDVRLHRPVERFAGDVENGLMRLPAAGVVHEDVDSSKAIDGSGSDATISFGDCCAAHPESDQLKIGLDCSLVRWLDVSIFNR